MYTLVREQILPLPRSEVFPFFSDPYNLELLTPPWLSFKVLTVTTPQIEAGTEVAYRLKVHGVPMRWRSLIEEFDPGNRFVDLQLQGPYAHWRHQHQFLDCDGGTLVRDTVHYALPFGPLGRIAHRFFVSRDLDRIFAYRQEALKRHLLNG